MVNEGEHCAAFISKADCSVSHNSDSAGKIDSRDPVGRAELTNGVRTFGSSENLE
jgi:hypothetical protein